MARVTQIQVRRDTEAAFIAAQTTAGATPILAAGEIGFISSSTNAGKFKIGDGTTLWGSLPYSQDVSLLTGTTLPTTITTANGITSASSLATVGTITTGTWNGGVIANTYTTATSANTNSAIVTRDGAGNFSASTITASAISGLTTPLSGAQGGTGVANTGKTIAVSGNTQIGLSGSTHTVTMTTSANTAITLPTSGTLVGSADSKTVTTAMLADYVTAPTAWFSTSASLTLTTAAAVSTAGSSLTGTYDCFNLSKGVTGLTPNSTYLVDYYILGTVTSGSASQKINLGVTGDSVANFNFHTSYGYGTSAATGTSTWANSNNGYINLKDTTTSIGAVGTLAGGSFAIRISGILRTGASATDNNFQVKIGVSIASSTTINVLRESFGSLRLIGTSGATPLGSWS